MTIMRSESPGKNGVYFLCRPHRPQDVFRAEKVYITYGDEGMGICIYISIMIDRYAYIYK